MEESAVGTVILRLLRFEEVETANELLRITARAFHRKHAKRDRDPMEFDLGYSRQVCRMKSFRHPQSVKLWHLNALWRRSEPREPLGSGDGRTMLELNEASTSVLECTSGSPQN